MLDVPSAPSDAHAQATYGMANLRGRTTGLPFIVFISQRGGARHDVRVQVSPAPKVREDQMSSYGVRPFGHREGPRLSVADETLLERWVLANRQVLAEYWDGEIEYTEDAIERLVKAGAASTSAGEPCRIRAFGSKSLSRRFLAGVAGQRQDVRR